jgi:hypothetical protein
LEARKNDYKKTISADAARVKRVEATIQIRTNKRRERANKRRQARAEKMMGSSALAKSSAETELTSVPKELHERHLDAFVAAARSSDAKTRKEGVMAIRRLLSREQNPPCYQVAASGVVPTLVEMLKMHEEDLTLAFEAAWAITNIASTDLTHVVVEAGAVDPIIELVGHCEPEMREQAIWCLGNIVGDGPAYRDMVINHPLGVANVVKNVEHPHSAMMLRNATWTLSNFCRGKPQPSAELVEHLTPYFAQLLQSDDEEVVVDAAWALSYATDGDDEHIAAVLACSEAVPILVQCMGHTNISVQSPALRALGNLVTAENPALVDAVLEHPFLEALVTMLACERQTLRREACWTLSNIGAGTEEHLDAMFNTDDLIAGLLHVLSEDSFAVRREAMWVVSNVACTGKPRHVAHLIMNGGVDAVCKHLTVQDNKIVYVALEAVYNFLRVWREHPESLPEGMDVSMMVEEVEGVEAIEALQDHAETSIYKRAVEVLEKYFESDEMEEEDGENVGPSLTDGVGGKVFALSGATTSTAGGASLDFSSTAFA